LTGSHRQGDKRGIETGGLAPTPQAAGMDQGNLSREGGKLGALHTRSGEGGSIFFCFFIGRKKTNGVQQFSRWLGHWKMGPTKDRGDRKVLVVGTSATNPDSPVKKKRKTCPNYAGGKFPEKTWLPQVPHMTFQRTREVGNPPGGAQQRCDESDTPQKARHNGAGKGSFSSKKEKSSREMGRWGGRRGVVGDSGRGIAGAGAGPR